MQAHDEARDLRRLFHAERSRLLTLARGVEAASVIATRMGNAMLARELRELAREATEGRR